MANLETTEGGTGISVPTDVAVRVARWLNPLLSSPSATMETMAWLDSFGPSLMPRTSQLQGVAGGLSVLSARAAMDVVERTTSVLLPDEVALRRRLGTRAAIGLAGLAASRLAVHDAESLWRAGARTSGQLLWLGSVGGAIHDLGQDARQRLPAGRRYPIATTATSLAGLAAWAGRLLTERTAAVEPWPLEQRATLPASLGATAATTAGGMALFRAYLATRTWWIEYLGASLAKQVLARSLNAGIWAVGVSAAYNAGVGYVGRANETVEPGYANVPANPSVSGSPASVSPFTDLGLQGRRYVTDVITPEVITEVMQEPAAAHPIRVYVGYDSQPLYPTGRAELALEELERTGAYDRRWLLLVAPTGTGWVDHTMIESAELLTRGDIATACIQYGRFPSFLSIQKVALGRSQFRLLLLGVRQRLRGIPPERRPTVLVFGESLGAWSSSDVVMYQGVDGFDHYGIDTALWVGLPGLAKWSRNGMARGRSDLVPPGTVRAIDHPDELDGLSGDERDRLRAVILSHDNDPIAQLVGDLAVKAPDWLTGERGRGVPSTMRWRPFTTFWQTAIDAANAMVTVPGEFLSYGHDYRADMARVVHATFALPQVTDDQLARVEATLRVLEVERAQRIDASTHETPPPPPMHRPDARHHTGGVPLRVRRTRGAAWRRRR